MAEIKILSVNISGKKGIKKRPVDFIELDDQGIINDAHSGNWKRQISLLGMESIEKYSTQAGREIGFGEFAENITTGGMPLKQVSPLDHFRMGDLDLEITQLGKKCHGSSCKIFEEVGDCVMPKEGIFCRVLQGGKLKKDDQLEHIKKKYRVRIITLSDRAYEGEYEDRSGMSIHSSVERFMDEKDRDHEIIRQVIPDEKDELIPLIQEAVSKNYDVLITTGGTGIGTRDITPDTIRPMLDKEIPGIMEIIRVKHGLEKPGALLSRSVAGIIGKTLVYCIPGSEKAVQEYMEEILKTLEHSIYMMHDLDVH